MITRLLGPAWASDEQAMEEVKASASESSFAHLVARWEGPIQRLCHRMVGDLHRAEDLTQEVFQRLFARRASYEVRARFSTYLWQIALNLCRDELRRRGRSREVVGWDPAGEGEGDPPGVEGPLGLAAPGPDFQLAREEEARSVRWALGCLPVLQREVLVLRHYEGLKFREIAEVLGIPEGTVKSRMAEGLTRMGRLLATPGPREGGVSGGLDRIAYESSEQ